MDPSIQSFVHLFLEPLTGAVAGAAALHRASLIATEHSSHGSILAHIFREFQWFVTVLHISNPYLQRHRSPIRSFNPAIQQRTFATAAFPKSFSASSVFNAIRSHFAMCASPPSPMTRVLWLEPPSFGVHSIKQKFSPAPSDSILSVVRFLRTVLVHESFQLIQAFQFACLWFHWLNFWEPPCSACSQCGAEVVMPQPITGEDEVQTRVRASQAFHWILWLLFLWLLFLFL